MELASAQVIGAGLAAIGVGAAAAAVLLHGMVDSFLGFTPTYVLIAITFGFVAACAGGLEHDHDADCI